MAAQKFKLNFDGYWRESNVRGIPSESGVYCVYECTYYSNANSVAIRRLIYVGEAGNVCDRIMNHEGKDAWRNGLSGYNELCFSYAHVGPPHRERSEAALIFKHKPPLNDEYKWSFPFDDTTMSLSGKNALLSTYFTVVRTC